MRWSVTRGTRTWIREAGPPFYSVVTCFATLVAELVGGNHYLSSAHCWSMVSCFSFEIEKVPGSISVVVVIERWMRGQGSGLPVVAAASSSSMQQLRHDPRPVVVNAKTETFGA